MHKLSSTPTPNPPKKVQNLNNKKYGTVKTGKYLSSEFKMSRGLRQRDAIAPLLFNVVMEIAVKSRHMGNHI
jgi:hypothetical protein